MSGSRINAMLATVMTLLVLVGVTFVFVVAPIEVQMREIQKIFYFHVGTAWSMFVAFTVTAIYGIVYLVRRKPRADAIAAASAEVGWVYAAVVLLTGMLWARSAWNVWWNWEPRLTSMLVLWLMYAGYLLFRSTTKGDVRRTYSSVFGILAFVMVPIVYFSIRIWGSVLHPNEKTKFNLDNRMYHGMALGTLAMLAAYVLLTRLRADADIAEQEVAALRQEQLFGENAEG
ncbi:MAG: cytochrome c biogenesis protein CcsA [Candidatus Poribacteria bacterium]